MVSGTNQLSLRFAKRMCILWALSGTVLPGALFVHLSRRQTQALHLACFVAQSAWGMRCPRWLLYYANLRLHNLVWCVCLTFLNAVDPVVLNSCMQNSVSLTLLRLAVYVKAARVDIMVRDLVTVCIHVDML